MSYVFFIPSESNLREKIEGENIGTHGNTLRCQELNTKKERRSLFQPQEPQGMNKMLLRHNRWYYSGTEAVRFFSTQNSVNRIAYIYLKQAIKIIIKKSCTTTKLECFLNNTISGYVWKIVRAEK